MVVEYKYKGDDFLKIITEYLIMEFKKHLQNEEKSEATIEKYLRDIKALKNRYDSLTLTKEMILKYKKELMSRYATRSVNSIISSINCFFDFNEWYELKIKLLKIQKQIFYEESKNLTRQEYQRLCKVAEKKKKQRLSYIMQTICSTGIRISELKYITAEAVKSGEARINCKGKIRIVMLSKALCMLLSSYMRKERIKSGSVFVTKNGKPLDRSNVWAEMKKLCDAANVDSKKVFPHNLRHLFARTFYSIQKDIVRLADLLGHSSINTTRIYTMETGEFHRKQIQYLSNILLNNKITT